MSIRQKTRVRNGITESYYEVSVSGYDKNKKRIQRKRRAKNKAHAREIERELYDELAHIKKFGHEKTFADFLTEYLDYITDKKSKGTVASERASLMNHTLPLLGNKELSKIEAADIEHIVHEYLKTRTTGTRRHCFNYLNNLFKLAVKKRYCKENPCRDVTRVKVRTKSKDILNTEQIRIFLEITAQYFKEWLPHFMIVCHCGLRAAEVRGLQWGDIDWVNNTIYLNRTFTPKDGIKPTLKSGKPRTVPMNPELKALLEQEKNRQNPVDTDWVFERHSLFMRNEQAKIVRDVCRVAGLKECTFHQLRDACITNLANSGVAIGVVMNIAGHQLLSTTNRYFAQAGIPVQGATNHISFMNSEDRNSEENEQV